MKYLLFIFFLGCSIQERQEVFILPSDFNGRVIIFYGVENGISEEELDRKATYYIPESGILLLKKKQSEGVSQAPQFFIKGDTLLQIKHKQNGENISDDKKYVFSFSNGELTKEYGSKPINYSIFLVGTRFQYYELLNSKFNINWDSLLLEKNLGEIDAQ